MPEHLGTQAVGYPKPGFLLQRLEQWPDHGNTPCRLGSQENTENTDHLQAQFLGDLVTAPFIHQDGISMDLNSQR